MRGAVLKLTKGSLDLNPLDYSFHAEVHLRMVANDKDWPDAKKETKPGLQRRLGKTANLERRSPYRKLCRA